LAAFPEELFVILRVYADESYAETAEVLCGFMAASHEWAKFSIRWKSVLRDFAAPYFHFREFVDKNNKWKIPNNPYLSWDDKKRDRFLIELAIVISEALVPVGGILNVEEFNSREMEKEFDAKELLIGMLYVHFSQQLNSHWPGFDGKVLFVFDETTKDRDDNWTARVSKVHYKACDFEPRIGGLAFEDDLRCPPLQAADLYAYISRQNTEKYYDQGRKKQLKRHLDWIISKNYSPKYKKEHSQEWWERLVRIVLADRKRKKAIWAKQGEPKKPYLPERDFEPEKYGYTLIQDVYE
jgi:hypothetical protein